MARGKGAYERYLRKRRRDERLAAGREAEVLAARLQAHLGPEQWAMIEAKWEARPDLYLPDQRRDFLIGEATRLGMLDLAPLPALGG